MKKNRKILLIIVGFVLYSFALVKLTTTSPVVVSNKTNDPQLARFIENYNNLKENWYYFTDEKKVIDAATQAMTSSSLDDDKYTMYIESDQSEEYFSEMDSEYVGIGIQYIAAYEYPIISKVFNNSPAAKSKLMAGDNIIAVDGTDLKNKKTEDIKKLVAGKENTTLTTTILRNNKKHQVKLERKPIEASVHYELKGKTGYLDIAEFTKTTPKEVEKALTYFSEKKASKVILDLRDNPGGYLDALEDVADLFLKKGNIVLSTKDKKGNKKDYKTKNNNAFKNNYIILTNGNSASASEAFTACLNENLNVPIYGEKTFGKGIMQTFNEYSDGAYLKFTSAEWLTPKGHAINKKGIEPTKKIKKSKIYNAVNLGYNFEKDIKNNTVSKDLVSYQKALDALGYKVDRFDGYYSPQTQNALNKFKKDNALTKEKDLSRKTQSKILEKLFIETSKSKNDLVLKEALR